MTGLVLKDFMLMKKNALYIAVVMLFFAGIYGSMGGDSFVSFFVSVMVVSILISTMSYDEFYHWERYAAVLPLSRRQIVGAKYLTALLFFAIGGLYTMAIDGASLLLRGGSLSGEALLVMVLAPLTGMVGAAVTLPFYYRFGAQRSRTAMLVFYGVPSLLLVVVARFAPGLLKGGLEVSLTPGRLLAGCALFTAAALGISFLLSVRILEKKEIK